MAAVLSSDQVRRPTAWVSQTMAEEDILAEEKQCAD
jgi:hypothetical protein